MKDTIGTNRDIYVPYEMKNNLPVVYVENEIRTLDEFEKMKLAENFFAKGIDYIREITESDGSTIYVDNKKILRLNINGTLEYQDPLEEDINKKNLYESMKTSLEFISKNTGVPKDIYIDKIEEIDFKGSLGYKLTFKYRIRGIPIILGNKEVVDFRGVKELESLLLSIENEGDTLIHINSAPKAILSLLSMEEVYGKRIIDIALCYYFDPRSNEHIQKPHEATKGKAVPAWRVLFNDGDKIIIDNY